MPWRWPRNWACGPLQAHCRRSLGTPYGKLGRQEQARAELDRRDRPLPRHGHDLLAPPGGGGAGAHRRMRAPREGVPRGGAPNVEEDWTSWIQLGLIKNRRSAWLKRPGMRSCRRGPGRLGTPNHAPRGRALHVPGALTRTPHQGTRASQNPRSDRKGCLSGSSSMTPYQGRGRKAKLYRRHHPCYDS